MKHIRFPVNDPFSARRRKDERRDDRQWRRLRIGMGRPLRHELDLLQTSYRHRLGSRALMRNPILRRRTCGDCFAPPETQHNQDRLASTWPADLAATVYNTEH